MAGGDFIAHLRPWPALQRPNRQGSGAPRLWHHCRGSLAVSPGENPCTLPLALCHKRRLPGGAAGPAVQAPEAACKALEISHTPEGASVRLAMSGWSVGSSSRWTRCCTAALTVRCVPQEYVLSSQDLLHCAIGVDLPFLYLLVQLTQSLVLLQLRSKPSQKTLL